MIRGRDINTVLNHCESALHMHFYINRQNDAQGDN